jgi:integration host factor subunit alpha
MTITKANLVKQVFNTHPSLTKAQSVEAVESFLSIAKSNLIKGDNLLLSGFGKFCVNNKKPRQGRNPQTGQLLLLEGRRVITFRLSALMRKRINVD